MGLLSGVYGIETLDSQIKKIANFVFKNYPYHVVNDSSIWNVNLRIKQNLKDEGVISSSFIYKIEN